MKRMMCLALTAALLLGAGCGEKESGPDPALEREPYKTDGQLYAGGEVSFPAALWETPAAERAPQRDDGEIEAYFLDSVGGTKVFAYVGVPASEDGKPAPGIVLVHGGGGTAFSEWVRMWNAKGYAAIAMDTDGHVPAAESGMDNDIHADSPLAHGPANTAFADENKPIEEQWAYHAMASIIVSNSLLRSLAGVDPSRIGLTGISYGGFLASAATGYDDRFAFCVPVYGSVSQRGGTGEFGKIFKARPRAAALWDDLEPLKASRTPIFFLNGSNDLFFDAESTSICADAAGKGSMLIEYRLSHSHLDGARPEEVFAYADWICKEGAAPVRILKQPGEGNASLTYLAPSGVTVEKAMLYSTDLVRPDSQTEWNFTAVKNVGGGTVSFEVPQGARVYFINLVDSRGLSVSTRLIRCK